MEFGSFNLKSDIACKRLNVLDLDYACVLEFGCLNLKSGIALERFNVLDLDCNLLFWNLVVST